MGHFRTRFLRLIPTLLGGVVCGFLMQVGPHEAEGNICGWLQLLFPSATEKCLGTLPPGSLWLVVGILMAGGIAWFFWPEPSSHTGRPGGAQNLQADTGGMISARNAVVPMGEHGLRARASGGGKIILDNSVGTVAFPPKDEWLPLKDAAQYVYDGARHSLLAQIARSTVVSERDPLLDFANEIIQIYPDVRGKMKSTTKFDIIPLEKRLNWQAANNLKDVGKVYSAPAFFDVEVRKSGLNAFIEHLNDDGECQ